MTDKEVGRLHEVRIFSSELFAVEVGREADWLIKSFIRERERETGGSQATLSLDMNASLVLSRFIWTF